MKLLVIFAGLLWMDVFTTAIPLDAARKNFIKTSDAAVVDESKAQNKAEEAIPTFNEMKEKAPGNSDAAIPPKKVKSGKTVLTETSNAAVVDKTKVEKNTKDTLTLIKETVPDLNEVKEHTPTNIDGSIPPKKVKSDKKKLTKALIPVSGDNVLKSTRRKIKAKIDYSDSDDALPTPNKSATRKQQNKTIDLSDIDDVLPDKLKKKYGDYVRHGFGKNIDELKNIRKKLKILKRITGKNSTASSSNKNLSANETASSDVDDLLFQGDQELDEAQLNSVIESTARHYGVDLKPLEKFGIKNRRQKRQAMIEPNATPINRLWPTGVIKYYYDNDINSTTRNIITKAFENIANQTCLQFAPSSSALPRIQFVNWGDCSSPIGYYPNVDDTGLHQIKVAGCLTRYGMIAHEILHVLGIFHHQTRSDRDSYLKNVVGEEILDDKNSENYGSPYDYGSVMHYGGFETVQPFYQQTIGHRLGPSFIDIAVLNQRYSCFCKNPTVTCLNGGYPNPKNCDTCICPRGYGTRTCNGIDPGTENESEKIDVTSNECQTFERSVGTDTDLPFIFHQKLWFQFKAPSGKKVQFIFLKGSDSFGTYNNGCDRNGIEVKINKSHFNRTGLVFCADNEQFISASNDDIKTFTTTGNMGMLQLYSRQNKVDLIVKYRFVDSGDDEIPSSCFPVAEECQNVNSDESCEAWNADPTEDCEADPGYMLKNCARTCGNC